jgi:chitinase
LRIQFSLPFLLNSISSTSFSNMKLIFPTFCLFYSITILLNSNQVEARKSVVCYFTNWSWYRLGNGKFTPSDIDPNLCSHIIYAFARLNENSLLIESYDTWADIDNRFYERVTDFRHHGIQVLLAIGGWNDSYYDKYSRLIRDAGARARFVRHVIAFLQQHNFQGLDLDFEYPVCWQNDCSRGNLYEKYFFGLWVKELKEAFISHGLILSAAVSASKKIIDLAYDVPVLARYLDFLNIMTYDYHGSWDNQTGHVSPLRNVAGVNSTLNTEWSVKYWISLGFPKEKIIMGIPTYGQSFSLSDPKNTAIGAPVYGGGKAGEYTLTAGILSYYEICERVNVRYWHTNHDLNFRMGPFSYFDDQWVGYDDKDMILVKAKFINQMGLGGAMIWSLDFDDFTNICGYGKYPLLSTIRNNI